MSTSPRIKSSKPAKIAKLRQRCDGTIQALSSNGRDVYVVTLGDAPSCTCLGFVHHGHCYHVSTALTRVCAFYTAPWVVGCPEPDPDPEPEPPFPAAPAALRPMLCQAALYLGCECPTCQPVAA